MSSYNTFTFDDLFTLNSVNLDQLTETYGNNFYGEYLTHWPEYQVTARHPSGLLTGYILGKAEGNGEDWHAHVSAVTVAPTFRRLGLGDQLMQKLEELSTVINKCYFVDLFVRASNEVAISMYKKFGYVVYRKVLQYYRGGEGGLLKDEDAIDMRKALMRDKERSISSCIPVLKPVKPENLEWD